MDLAAGGNLRIHRKAGDALRRPTPVERPCLQLGARLARRPPRLKALVLNLAPESEVLALLVLLDRVCAMLTQLAHMSERPSGPAQAGQVSAPCARER
jgi:hypothetical protein